MRDYNRIYIFTYAYIQTEFWDNKFAYIDGEL